MHARSLHFVLAVALSAIAGSRPTHAQLLMPAPIDEAVVEALHTDLVEATRRMADNNVAGADPAFDKVISSPAFGQLEPGQRYSALLRAGIAALDVGASAKAHGLLVRACEFDDAEGIAWHLRLRAAYELDDYLDSALSVSAIALRWPETLDQIRPQAIFDISTQLKRSGRGERIVLLTALFSGNWTVDGREPRELWFDFLRYLLEQSDLARATEVVARFDSAETILSLRIDKRFDTLGRSRSGSFDMDRAMKRERERVLQFRERSPNSLNSIIGALVLDLRDGHPERALETADAVIARVASSETPPYTDSDRYNWILDSRAIALQRLGRWDEAVAQQRKAARRPESGRMNVSQSLNLARLLARLHRGDEAEEAMEELGNMSPYGRMQFALNRLIAAHSRSDEKEVSAQLDVMRVDREHAMSTYQAALVIAGEANAAAELLVERLRSEEWRKDALADMQTYAAVAQTPLDKEHLTRWREILARKEVRNALDEVGRVEQVPFANPLL